MPAELKYFLTLCATDARTEPAAGKVVAYRILPGKQVVFAGPAIVTQIILDADDAEILRVWRISLRRPLR